MRKKEEIKYSKIRWEETKKKLCVHHRGYLLQQFILKRSMVWSVFIACYLSIVDFHRLLPLEYEFHAIALDNLWIFAHECEPFLLARTVIHPIHNGIAWKIIVRFVLEFVSFSKRCEYHNFRFQFKIQCQRFYDEIIYFC